MLDVRFQRARDRLQQSKLRFQRVRDWLRDIIVESTEADQPRVDRDYLTSERVSYRWLTVRGDGDVRCDICGLLMPLDEMPEMIEHVGQHDDDGAAEVDPTEVKADKQWKITVSDQREPWQETEIALTLMARAGLRRQEVVDVTFNDLLEKPRPGRRGV